MHLRERSCSDGCDLEFFGGPFESRLEVFCRETPVAEEGDACGTRGCLPTRAVVQPHGSVLQTYLECAATTQRCVTAPPPLVPSYLEACPAAAAQFGAVDVEGHAYDVDTASPCLIAWDSELSASRHGRTIRCFGDWECPADSTCDDSIVSLPSGTRFEPVCRPGPRGAPLVDHLPAPR